MLQAILFSQQYTSNDKLLDQIHMTRYPIYPQYGVDKSLESGGGGGGLSERAREVCFKFYISNFHYATFILYLKIWGLKPPWCLHPELLVEFYAASVCGI